MPYLNTIVEFEGPVVNVRPRYWAAHQAAIKPLKFEGPSEEEFWRLLRLRSDDAAFVPRGKTPHVAEYKRVRDERIDSSELMALDELQPGAAEELRVLKAMGSCQLATLSQNRDGVNATLNRLDVWMYFDGKRSLPTDSKRRFAALRELAGGQRTLAIVGSVPMAYAAGEAGCLVVGVRCGQAFPRALQQVGVDLVYDHLGDLTEALSRRDPQLQRIGLF